MNMETTTNPSGVEARRDPSQVDPVSAAIADSQMTQLAFEFGEEDQNRDVVTPTPEVDAPGDGPIGSTPPAPAAGAKTEATAPASGDTTSPTAVPPVIPPVPPVTATPVPATAAVTPATEPVAPATETPPVPPVAEPPKAWTQEDTNKWMATGADDLAKTTYAFSAEDMAEFELNPGEVISKKLAAAHMTLLTSMSQAMVSQLPYLMQHVNTQQTQYTEAVEEFYGTWPELAKVRDKVGTDAERMALDYRARNPHATKSEVIRDVGVMVHMQHKIPMPELMNPNGVGTTPQPYTPPQGGGGVAGNTAPRAPQNQIEQFAEELMQED